MTTTTGLTAIIAQRDAAEQKARDDLRLYAPELADATCWHVYRTVVDEEQYQGRTWSAEAALAYVRNGQRVERAA